MREIRLTRGKVAIVDDEDYGKVSHLSWRAQRASKSSQCFYASTGWKTTVLMHRILMSPPQGYCIDHINGNGLDNRRCNLRIVTTLQNSWNASIAKNNTSGLKGVSWNAQREQWIAQIAINRKRIFLGRFPTKEAASEAYQRVAKETRGEFHRKNS